MKICHLVLAHKHPLLLGRLLKNLAHPNAQTYVHVDRKFDCHPFRDAAKSLSNVRFVKMRTTLHWGGPSIVNAVAHALMEIRASGEEYDFINLISAQDFPIKPMDAFVEFLSANKQKQFISYMTGAEADKWWHTGANRFQKYHFNELDVRFKYFFQGIANTVLPKRSAPSEWELVGGNCATWWTLQSACAYHMAATILHDKKVRDFIRMTWGIDEIIFPTLVLNSPFRETVVNNNLRHIDWQEQQAHPAILSTKDFDQLRDSPQFFARKFDLKVDADILDMIENRLLHSAPE